MTQLIASGASAAGFPSIVICFGESYTGTEDVDGVRVIRAKVWAKVFSQPLGLGYFFKSILYGRRADIIHLHAPNMLAMFACIFVQRSRKLIVHWHSDVVGKGILSRILSPLEKSCLRRADSIVCTSENYANSSNTLTNFLEKTSVIPLGVQDPKASPEEPSDRSLPEEMDEALLGGKQLILAVGRLVPYKGFDDLIQAATEIDSSTSVIIVGQGPLYAELKQKICDLGLTDRVHLVGRLSEKSLSALMYRAHLLCLPSVARSEAFGVVILEALARSIPVVSTNVPGSGISWVNADGQSGLTVPIHDPMALAAACMRILTDDKLHEKLSVGARRRYEELFQAADVNDSFKTLYQSLLK